MPEYVPSLYQKIDLTCGNISVKGYQYASVMW